MRCEIKGAAALALGFLSAMFAVSRCPAADARRVDDLWQRDQLFKKPQVYPADEYATNDVRVAFLEGLPYRGKPTRIFCYYGVPRLGNQKKVPAMVLVHGGGGSAFYRWVKFWNARGYAAISMDLNGCVSGNVRGHEQREHFRHAWAGPGATGCGGFDLMGERLEDQWMYHAVGAVVRAHTFLAAQPGVDPARVGLTGVSWGGVVSCVVSAIDDRFKFAAPVYGCGYMFEDFSSWWQGRDGDQDVRNRRDRWSPYWDPSEFLGRAKMPVHWLVGTDDECFSLLSVERSRRLVPGVKTLSVKPHYLHTHGPESEEAVEVTSVADHYLKGTSGIPMVGNPSVRGRKISALFDDKQTLPVVSARLEYTCDNFSHWYSNRWSTVTAAVSGNSLTATLPEGTTWCCLSVLTENGATFSSRVVNLPAARIDGVNVKDFGAVGDGVSDDTAAICRAIEAAETRRRELPSVQGGKIFYADHLYCEEGPIVDIVFPDGEYAVSNTIFLGRYSVLRGIGNVRIIQRDPKATTFFFHRVNQARVENLSFSGGKTHLDFTSLNSEGCNLQLKGCRFEYSTGPAVKSISWKKKGQPDNNECNIGEYAYDEKSGRLVADERYRTEALARQNNSTMFAVDGCTFYRCARAADYACDGSVWRNCRIVTRRDMKGGAVRVTNRIHVFGMGVVVDRDSELEQGIFEVTPSFEAEDSSPLVFVEDSSFKTIDGSGVCLIRSTTVPCYRSSTIVVRNCDTECAGCPEGAIVYVGKGTSPNLISVIGCREHGRGMVKAIRYETEPNADWLKSLAHYSHLSADRQYRYCVEKNSPNVDADLGPWISSHSDRYFSGADAKPPVAFKRMKPNCGKTYFAADYGVVADAKTDVTEPLQKLMRMAEREKDSCVILPAGSLKVSDTLQIGGTLTVAAEGMSLFQGLLLDRWFFTIAPGAKVAFRNLIFMGGRGAVSYDAASSAPTGVFLDNCRAYGPGEVAYHVVSRGYPRAAKLRAVNGMCYASTMYCGNADATFDGIWYRMLPSVEDSAVPMPEVKGLVNLKGGRLVVRDGLGVPFIVHFRTKNGAETNPELKKEEYRWIDNHGEYYSQCTRYGGERGGVTPVFSYGKGPVCIEGEHAGFWANNMQRSAIVNDTPDADCRIFDVVFPAETMWLPRIDPSWRKFPGARLEYYEDCQPVCVFPVPARALSRNSSGGSSPTLFFAGDSTLDDNGRVPCPPYVSWGTELEKLMKPGCRVRNFAQSGESTKSFRDSGRWQKLITEVRPGDFVAIQFGHNDQKRSTPYYRENRWADPNGLFADILRDWILEVRSKGACPILVSPICRGTFDESGRKLVDVEHRSGDVCLESYRDVMASLSCEFACDFVDMNHMTRDLLERVGKDAAMRYFAISSGLAKGKDGEPSKDVTHPIQAGAEAFGRLFVNDVRTRGVPVAELFCNR